MMKMPQGEKLHSGFSLLELVVSITIIVVLTGSAALGVRSYQTRNIDFLARQLKNQIERTRQASEIRTDDNHLKIYLREKEYLCQLEFQNPEGNWKTEETEAEKSAGSDDTAVDSSIKTYKDRYQVVGKIIHLGSSDHVTIRYCYGDLPEPLSEGSGTPIGDENTPLSFTFDHNTGELTGGETGKDLNIIISGYEKTNIVTIYQNSGYVSIDYQ